MGTQVWVKPLRLRNEVAVALLNQSENMQEIGFELEEIGISQKSAFVRDIWEKTDLGDTNKSVSLSVPPHGTRLLRVLGL